MDAALAKLEDLTIEEIGKAYSEWRLVDMLSQTRLSEKTRLAVQKRIAEQGWLVSEIKAMLKKMMAALEARNRKIAGAWLDILD